MYNMNKCKFVSIKQIGCLEVISITFLIDFESY